MANNYPNTWTKGFSVGDTVRYANRSFMPSRRGVVEKLTNYINVRWDSGARTLNLSGELRKINGLEVMLEVSFGD